MKNKIIPMTYDVMFKSVLLNKEARGYLINILHLITKIPKEELANLTFKNTEHPKTGVSEKKKESDIIIEIKGNTIIMEMNKNYHEGLMVRNFIYGLTTKTHDVSNTKDYKDVNHTILINFDNFNKYNDDRSVIKFEMLDKERLVEEKVGYESYHIILPNIENKYYNEDSLNKLEKMLEIINIKDEKELISYSSDEDVGKVVNLIMKLSRDEELQGWYDKEELNKMYMNGDRKAAKEEGIRETKIETAKKLLEENISYEIITKVTNLTKEEIDKLQ